MNEILPALFEKTNDYTELLLNLSVVDQDGVVYHLIHDIDEDDFNIEKGGQVEIIGWLYQYYNTEPKNAAFAKNGKITKDEIPAVTQLFTPDWIVRYMVQNSLGRLFIDKRKNEGIFADGRGLDEMTWDEAEEKRIAAEKYLAEQMEWKYYLPEAAQTKEVREQLDKIQQQSEYKDCWTPCGMPRSTAPFSRWRATTGSCCAALCPLQMPEIRSPPQRRVRFEIPPPE